MRVHVTAARLQVLEANPKEHSSMRCGTWFSRNSLMRKRSGKCGSTSTAWPWPNTDKVHLIASTINLKQLAQHVQLHVDLQLPMHATLDMAWHVFTVCAQPRLA